MIYLTLAVCFIGAASGDRIGAHQQQSFHGALPIGLFQGSGLMQAHGLSESSLREVLAEETQRVRSLGASASSSSSSHPLLSCGPLSEMRAHRSTLMEQHGMSASDVRVAYQSREENLGCLLVHAAAHQMEAAGYRASTMGADTHTATNAWHYSAVPSFLKVQPSVIETARELLGSAEAHDSLNIPGVKDAIHPHGKEKSEKKKKHPLKEESESRPGVETSSLHVRFFQSTTGTHVKRILDSASLYAPNLHSTSASASSAWLQHVSRVGSSIVIMGGAACGVPEKHVHVHQSAFVITNVASLPSFCLASIIETASADPAVASVSMSRTPHVSNHASRGAVQSGTVGSEPYSAAGLTGKNQIVAVMDTGLDDLSCFFAEESCSGPDTSKCLTPRNASADPSRRKVIQYTPYGDGADGSRGIGTHVVGTIVGSPVGVGYPTDFNSMQGIAFDAQVVMQDAEDVYGSWASVDAMSLEHVAFPSAYEAGARVHSNGWSADTSYSRYSAEVDSYLYSNNDMLIVVGVTNYGNPEGIPGIITPGTAKNALAVGSGQLRDVYDDSYFIEKTISSSSSTGPVQYGQIKPNIVAPGTSITSAYASGYDSYNAALATGSITQTCSAHEMSGTSMAASMTAGVALLVRQYFEDESFWAASCESSFSRCSGGAFKPKGYLVKAAIIHAGEPMDRFSSPNDQLPIPLRESKTPDVFQGYGMINLATLLPLPSLNQPFKLYVQDDLAVSEGRVFTWNVTVSDAESYVPLRVTLVWYDPLDGALLGALVHNLDLVVRDPEGMMHWGNGANLGDSQNPNEQVMIASPRCIDGNCVYSVIVRGVSVVQESSQLFGIVLTTAGAVSEAVESDGSMFDFNVAPEFEGVTVSVTYSSEVEEVVRVDLGPMSVSRNSTFAASFDIDASYNLSMIFVDFSDWKDPSNCPYGLSVTITDPSQRSHTISSWPYSHAVCFDSTFAGYASTYFPHEIGTDLLDLGGSGSWSIEIWPFYYSQTPMEATVGLVLTFSKQKPSYLEVPIERLIVEYADDSSYTFQVSGLPECATLAYVEMEYYKQGDCVSYSDTFDLVDPTGRHIALHQVYDWDWIGTQSTLYSMEMTSPARLGGNGVYTLYLYLNSYCDSFQGGYLDLNFHYASCTREMPVDVTYRTTSFDALISTCLVESPEYVGDGYCDAEGGYNVLTCDYDGGDCCVETCVSGSHECGAEAPYVCMDPKYSDQCVVDPDWIGDGYCDSDTPGYNTPQCNYDGGDCCEQSCVDGAEQCGSNDYECLDPEYTGSMTYAYAYGYGLGLNCSVSDPSLVGNGQCNGGPDYNTAECEYDGGDCCAQTCVSSAEHQCGDSDYVCMDPLYSTCSVENLDWIGDGWCDSVEDGYNTEACYYDGGDCCEQSCTSVFSSCGSDSAYNCTNPKYAGSSHLLPGFKLIDAFEHLGALETVTIDIEKSNYFAPYLEAVFALVIMDPNYRTVQIGGYNNILYIPENSLMTPLPSAFLNYPSNTMNSTSNVSAAGLFFDGTYSSDSDEYPYAFVGGLGSKAGTWKLFVLNGYDGAYFPEVRFRGAITLGFKAVDVPPVPPTRSPTPRPTPAPTNSPYGTFIRFETSLDLAGVKCSTFLSDLTAQDISRLATRDSMGVSDADILVVNVTCPGPHVTYEVSTNIDSLGYTSPEAAYDALVMSLNTAVADGSFTSAVHNYASEKKNSLMQGLTGASVASVSSYEVQEVSDGSSSSSSTSDLGAGPVAGIVIGVIAFMALAAVVVYMFAFKGFGSRSPLRGKDAVGSSSTGGVKVVEHGSVTLQAEMGSSNPIHHKTRDLEGL